ncbi:hypothetical protein [Glutamicibacter sp.]|uniref:hypothetical protein n=1 Tax=Glutamicibacter sp. TaxID=1931995 RepID=UPI0028BE3E88|nr:hypothetical protein [Glutamicibacter sp.]
MSEYQCEEPGCYFHIGIGGQVITDDDFEQQDYYNQEVEAHYQMHQEQNRDKAMRKAAAPFKRELRDRDKVCRVCGGEFSVDRKSTTSSTIMHLDPSVCSMIHLAMVHQGCLMNVALTEGNAVQRRIMVENFEMSLGGHVPMGPKKTLTHPRNDSGWAKSSDQGQNIGAAFEECAASGFPTKETQAAQAAEGYPNLREEVELLRAKIKEIKASASRSIARRHLDIDPFSVEDRGEGLSGLDCRDKHRLQGRDLGVNISVGIVLKGRAPINFSFQVLDDVQEISLSVNDASHDAVGGTSEFTERVHTPGSPEMKEPSAAATAEGDETKTETD